jgi:hypothetical protein
MGIGVFGKDKGFHSVTHPSPSLHAPLHLLGESQKQKESIFGIIFTHSFMSKGLIFHSKYPFLAINAKGGESISPKQKDRTTT